MELSQQVSGNSQSKLLLHSLNTIIITLLALLLPISYLLLARLNSPSPLALSSSVIISFALEASLTLLYSLVSFLSLAALLYMLTGHLFKVPASLSWVFLCLFQICITFVIGASTSGAAPPTPARSSNIGRVVFAIGLYETMLLWSRMFVRPIVDDTICATVKKEHVDRVVMGIGFSVLWMQVVRDEVEPLVLAVGAEGLRDAEKWGGFVCHLVSYATIVTGAVRLVEVAVWLGKLLFLPCKETEEVVMGSDSPGHDKLVDNC